MSSLNKENKQVAQQLKEMKQRRVKQDKKLAAAVKECQELQRELQDLRSEERSQDQDISEMNKSLKTHMEDSEDKQKVLQDKREENKKLDDQIKEAEKQEEGLLSGETKTVDDFCDSVCQALDEVLKTAKTSLGVYEAKDGIQDEEVGDGDAN